MRRRLIGSLKSAGKVCAMPSDFPCPSWVMKLGVFLTRVRFLWRRLHPHLLPQMPWLIN
jgi:hypothetical protein